MFARVSQNALSGGGSAPSCFPLGRVDVFRHPGSALIGQPGRTRFSIAEPQRRRRSDL